MIDPGQYHPRDVLATLLRSATSGIGSGIAASRAGARRCVVTYSHQGFAPVSACTALDIGSITKAFTGTVLADMVQRQQVRLDDPVAKHLSASDLPSFWSSITLLDLACHRSGLPRLPPNLEGPPSNPFGNWNRDKLYEAILQVPIDNPPEMMAPRYSNFGFAVLSEVLSQSAGLSFPDLVADRLCEPLRLQNTFASSLRQYKVPGYTWSGYPANHWEFNSMLGAGGLFSTVDDLLSISEAMLAEQSTPSDINIALQCAARPLAKLSDSVSFGLGWMITKIGGSTVVWASGNVSGSASFVGILLEARVAVAALLNASRPTELVKAGFTALSHLR